MIVEVEDYFTKGCGRCGRFDTEACSAIIWNSGLQKLRVICLSAGLEETVKWGQACYMHAGRNIAILGAFQDKFVIGFFNAALMQDPQGVLEKSGPNSQDANRICFTDHSQVTKMEKTLSAYIDEAKGYAEKGTMPPKNTSMPDLPNELEAVLVADVELAEAFHALTLGRQRSYVINLNGAKQSETRIKRIAKFREKIIAGKGAMER